MSKISLDKKSKREKISLPEFKILNYITAVVSVGVTLIVALFLDLHLVAAPVSLFFCAIMFSAWFGGTMPGLLSVVLSLLTFKFFFVSPVYSMAVYFKEIPRLILFALPALFIVLLNASKRSVTESFKHTSNILEETVQKLRQTNTSLQEEIAERKKSEFQIVKEEELSSEIIDSIPGVFMLLDENFRFLRWNKNVELVTGCSPEQILGSHAVNDFYHHLDERTEIQNLLEEILKKGTVQGEASPPTKDGSKLSFYFNGRLINYKGKTSIICTAIDITERKQAEVALRKSEDRIRFIIDTIPSLAWTLRPDGIVDFYNQRWLDYAGEGAIENPNGIIHPEDFPGAIKAWLLNMTTESSYEDEMRLRRADGEYRWFLVRTAPLRDEKGNIIKWYGISIDIEDHKRVQDELRSAYQRLSYHVENTPLAIIEFDKDLFIKRWSKRAEEIFGWKTSEALGKNVYDSDFSIIYKEDIPAVEPINEQLMAGTVDNNLSLNRNYNKEGKVIYCEWYNSVLRDEDNNVITILSLVLDVSERKKAEETLQKSYDEIRRLTDHLQKIREEERVYIAREIHDELGQQLTAIKMDVAWIDKKTSEETTDIKLKLKNIIGLLDGSNQSIKRILSELRPLALDDNNLLDALELLRMQFIENTGIYVKFTMAEKVIKVPGPIATCIFRICQEAFTNITRHSHAQNVYNSIKIIEKNIILVIEDDGIGFDEISEINKKSFGILGMRERVLSLNGKFELISSMGNGTKIKVRLPYEC